MSGIILLAVLIAWLAITYFVSRFLVRRIESPAKRIGVKILIAMIFFIAPVSDEIVGGIQFQYLCSTQTYFHLSDEYSADDERYVGSFKSQSLKGFVLPVEQQESIYIKLNTGKNVLSRKTLSAKGGWIMRSLNFNSTSNPIFFDGFCRSENEDKKILSQIDMHTIK